MSLEGADAGTRRLQAGPDQGSEHQKGTARVVLKAETYRLRPEGLPPAEMQRELSRLYYFMFASAALSGARCQRSSTLTLSPLIAPERP